VQKEGFLDNRTIQYAWNRSDDIAMEYSGLEKGISLGERGESTTSTLTSKMKERMNLVQPFSFSL
jgi:hypothetical protein